MQGFTKKNTFLYVFLVFIVTIYNNNAYAYLDVAGKFFIEPSQSFIVHSMATVTQDKTEVVNGVSKTTTTVDKYKSSGFNPKYQGSIAFGYKPANSSFSYSFQYDSFNLYYNVKNGSSIGSANGEEASFNLDAYTLNIQYDLFSWGNFTAFTKLGLGFMQFNQFRKNPQSAIPSGYKLEFTYNGVLGGYYKITNYLDVYLYYKVMSNISKKTAVSALGSPTKYDLLDGSIYLAVRFNL